jgi:hypothetical protein
MSNQDRSGAWHRPSALQPRLVRGNERNSRRRVHRDPVRCQARDSPRIAVGTIEVMADAASLDERLEQIGAQLDWVRDYL